MTSEFRILTGIWLTTFALATLADNSSLIVVQDGGGVSALSYYRGLHLQTSHDGPRSPLVSPAPPKRRYGEADFLPVRSRHLTPGTVLPRSIHAPGLMPIFLIGDDARSRTWLKTNTERLLALHATGLVVQVEAEDALLSLRRLAPGLTLEPTSGDDLAERLAIKHYPLLITATGIEP